MKTIREHLETLPEPWRTQAMENLQKVVAEEGAGTKTAALYGAFAWSDTPQGFDYWCDFYSTLLTTTL